MGNDVTPPRYFQPDGTPALPLPAPDATPLAEVLAVLHWGDARHPQPAAIVRDLAGRLLVVPEDLLANDATLRPSLVHAEFARAGKPSRFVASSELWMMTAELAELPEGGDPVAAPVKLTGTLFGPFAQSQTPVGQTGMLTVRRGDWLFGLLAGVRHAFVGGQEPNERLVHALLPGGPAATIVAGSGLMLTFPLLPVGAGHGNTTVVCQLLAELLENLRAALVAARADSAFIGSLVPVLDRADIEHRLVAKGFTIVDDTAVKTGLFVRDERLDLPKVGTLQDFVDSGELALQALAGHGYPDAPVRTLHGRVGGHPTLAALPPPQLPKMTSQPQVSPAPRQRQSKAPAPPAWLADFAPLPPPPGRAKMPPEPTPPSTPPAPDWLKDFE